MLKAESNFSLVIFGASGSLAKLKIFPSLYQLALEGRMPEDYVIVGYARSHKSNEQFRQEFAEAVGDANDMVDHKILNTLLDRVYYVSGQYDDEADFKKLSEELAAVEKSKDRVRLAYFSIPPSVFDEVICNLGKTLKQEDTPIRLILEKPFGTDYASAKALKALLTEHFDVEDLYLLDHYLGKEAVFNLLSLRYANSIFSHLIQGKYIANIQITAMESADIEGRAGYFDTVGIFRDMMQSHIFQILAFLGMYIPREFTSDLVHKSKVHLLDNLYFNGDPKNLVRGQYEGYLQEEGVAPDSKAETFAAAKVCIDSANWGEVPIYLRTGKALKQKWTGVVIEFKDHNFQRKLDAEVPANKLLIQLQPQEKIEFYLVTKQGGKEMVFNELVTGKPIFCSGDCLDEHSRLFLEVIRGDHMLFLDFPEIYEAWKVTDPVIELFKKDEVPLDVYERGGFGPKSADELIQRDGFEWMNIEM